MRFKKTETAMHIPEITKVTNTVLSSLMWDITGLSVSLHSCRYMRRMTRAI